MGASAQSELAVELTNSFCRTDPEIAKSAASVAVGEYMLRVIPRSTLSVIANIGHCPHLSSPSAYSATIDAFLVK